jgi:hypothetical protein
VPSGETVNMADLENWQSLHIQRGLEGHLVKDANHVRIEKTRRVIMIQP